MGLSQEILNLPVNWNTVVIYYECCSQSIRPSSQPSNARCINFNSKCIKSKQSRCVPPSIFSHKSYPGNWTLFVCQCPFLSFIQRSFIPCEKSEWLQTWSSYITEHTHYVPEMNPVQLVHVTWQHRRFRGHWTAPESRVWSGNQVTIWVEFLYTYILWMFLWISSRFSRFLLPPDSSVWLPMNSRVYGVLTESEWILFNSSTFCVHCCELCNVLSLSTDESSYGNDAMIEMHHAVTEYRYQLAALQHYWTGFEIINEIIWSTLFTSDLGCHVCVPQVLMRFKDSGFFFFWGVGWVAFQQVSTNQEAEKVTDSLEPRIEL